MTDEGLALLPTLSDAFARMETALEQIRENRPREVLTVGVVGTFAVGWLLPRLRHFQQTHPFVDLRLLTNKLADKVWAAPVNTLQTIANAQMAGSRGRPNEVPYSVNPDNILRRAAELVKAGVIDPVKVTRSALRNAASIASMVLTTDTLVVEKKEDEEPAAGGHGHGHGH